MARFTKSNRSAAKDMEAAQPRRVGQLHSPALPMSRRDFEFVICHPTSG